MIFSPNLRPGPARQIRPGPEFSLTRPGDASTRPGIRAGPGRAGPRIYKPHPVYAPEARVGPLATQPGPARPAGRFGPARNDIGPARKPGINPQKLKNYVIFVLQRKLEPKIGHTVILMLINMHKN